MPPNMMDPRLLQTPPQEPEQSFARFNPLPPGPQGNNVIRSASKCPVPKEAERLQSLMQQVLQSNDPMLCADDLAEAVKCTMLINTYCNKQLRTRTAAVFSEDPELKKLNDEFTALKNEFDEMQEQMTARITKLQELMRKRWEATVKNAGLNPDKRFYQINEEKGIVTLCDLDCSTCEASVKIRKCRQAVVDKLMLGKVVDKKEDEAALVAPSSETLTASDPPAEQLDLPPADQALSTNDQK